MAFCARLALSLSFGFLIAADGLPRPVRVQTVSYSAPEILKTYSGTIQARVQADLSFRVGGKILERPVNTGDHVKAGQILARLDPTDLRLALESSAEAARASAADAAQARADMRRYERLGRDSAAFLPAEYDRRRSALDGALARLAQARRQQAMAQDQLAYSQLRADADGLVAALPMQVGQVVQAGQTVATLAHSQEIEAVVDVPENCISGIRSADTVTITLWSDPDHVFAARLREVGALADAASRTFAVKVTLIDPPGQKNLLGMTATVRFARHAGPGVAKLPASALADLAGKPAVWVLDPAASRAALRPVRLEAASDNGMVEVSGGVRPGEQVVTAGTSEMRADLPVLAWPGAAH